MDFTQFATSRKKKPESFAKEEKATSQLSPVESNDGKSKSSSVEVVNSQKQQPQVESFDQFVSDRKIPIANQIDLTGHEKAVSCLSIEPAGNRVVTGSYDYSVKMYDFGGMDSRHRAFKSIEAQENHMVVAISHSPSGDRFIAATGSAQPKIYDREGKELIKFVRGDMYLRDLSNTKGHTMEVSGAQWHPTEKEVVLTCSLDGSLRIWDLIGESTFGCLVNKHVLKVRGLNGANRLGVTSCCFSPSAMKIVGGAADGSVHIWNERKIYSKADIVLRHPACADSPITSVVVMNDNNTLAARSASGHVFLWDIRNATTAKAPIKVFSDLQNDYPTANVAFSPDGTLLCCGTSPVTTVRTNAFTKTGASSSSSSSKCTSTETAPLAPAPAPETEASKSRLYFFDVAGPSTAPALSIAMALGATAIMVKWHPGTNQILCTLSSGAVRVL